MSVISKDTTFLGYRRENGRVGVRNHVIVLPLDDLSNAAAEAVAHNIKGAMAIPHPYGRLQFGADLDLHFRTLIGTGCNPNVAAVVVIGIEDGWTQKVVDGIKATGKPVCGFGIELHGDHDTIMRASKAAREYVQWASERQRERCAISELWVSTKCGESDTTSGCGANPSVGNAFDKLHPLGNYLCFGETTELTGGEHIVAARCATDEVRKKFQFMFDRYQEVINRHKTSDLSDSQPTKGNIAGGLTTIEEKALGNIQKIGRKCVVDGVIDKAEALRRIVAVGLKVAVECVLIAADQGVVSLDEEVVAAGGTASGADTVCVIRPAHTSSFFDLQVREIVAMPRNR